MKKDWIRKILMILLACIFLASGGIILASRYKYFVNERLNRKAVESYTVQKSESSASAESAPPPSAAPPSAAPQTDNVEDGTQTEPTGTEKETQMIRGETPIAVDFKALKELNPEIIGWIYCEDTKINFPIAQASDNDYYLNHAYDRSSNACGTVFADAFNGRDFVDSNTIIYGHHLYNGAMFGKLEDWFTQKYFDEHRIMWILTPDQDYRVELFSAYYTLATSDAYTLFQQPSAELDEYLAKAKSRSRVNADVELDGQAKYVVLSTCAYVDFLSRAVLHGKMVPVNSAGGYLIERTDAQN